MYRYYNYIAAYVAVIYALAGLYTLFVVSYYYFFTIKNKTSKMNRDVRRFFTEGNLSKADRILLSAQPLRLNFMEIPHVAVAFYRLHMMNDPIPFQTDDSRNEAHLYWWYVSRGIILPLVRLIEP